jgi:hypothetical protein
MKDLKLRNPIKFSSGSGLNNNSSPVKSFFTNRKSKQQLAANKMFGSRLGKHGKDFKIGKKFSSNKSMKSSSISPDVDEFDDMLSKASGNSKPKKSLFSKRY